MSLFLGSMELHAPYSLLCAILVSTSIFIAMAFVNGDLRNNEYPFKLHRCVDPQISDRSSRVEPSIFVTTVNNTESHTAREAGTSTFMDETPHESPNSSTAYVSTGTQTASNVLDLRFEEVEDVSEKRPSTTHSEAGSPTLSTLAANKSKDWSSADSDPFTTITEVATVSAFSPPLLPVTPKELTAADSFLFPNASSSIKKSASKPFISSIPIPAAKLKAQQSPSPLMVPGIPRPITPLHLTSPTRDDTDNGDEVPTTSTPIRSSHIERAVAQLNEPRTISVPQYRYNVPFSYPDREDDEESIVTSPVKVEIMSDILDGEEMGDSD
ncbi:hypothetical protein EJ08DRAFT_656704 [Tothia fuscella]|uniref:Uncharacterized protein n=1 Tax=Tothia fuscella TaxID=1048955 RepID=A0A9P4P0C3_9PEZI|nr:hypothetical protein EJ08DRAFT_656704 [Tothia fuscella]